MKIKLVTFFPHPNFGTCLQSYALNKVLRDMGHDVEFIYNRNEVATGEVSDAKKRELKDFLKLLLPDSLITAIRERRANMVRKPTDEPAKTGEGGLPLFATKLLIIELPNLPLLKILSKFKVFRERFYTRTYDNLQKKKVYKFTFEDGNYKPRRLYTKSDYKAVTKEADLFITGSDQIWNPFCGGFNPMMFLEFGGDKKRIAYSSSISRPDFPEEIRERVKDDLSKFKHIAVREQHSVELLNNMLGRNDVKLVVDPTMLLSKDDWDKFADRSVIEFDVPEKYIFCYFVGCRSEYQDMVNDVKKRTGINNVITLDCYGNEIRYGDGMVYHDGGPYEWVDLLRRSSIVCMDSFHATVFALKFHKDFVHILKTKETKESSKSSQNGRMYDILSRYGILYKLYNKENTEWLKPIDFDHVDKIMDEEIKDSRSYLKWEIEN